jgi:TatD DNase family protein
VKLPLPPLDAHAHVAPGVPAADLASLQAAVFAMTLSLSEWEQTAERTDELTAWGLGCHPAVSDQVEGFSPGAFSEALDSAALVGEVGLDARRGAAIATQKDVFSQILEMLADRPRLVSIHSVGAAGKVLDTLERHPQSGAILHWWRGSISETDRAVEMGCFFSLNAAEVQRPKVMDRILPERVLTETDFPHARRHEPKGARPGVVQTIEDALGQIWALDAWGVRRRIWANLAALLERTESGHRMPLGIRKALVVAPVAEGNAPRSLES